MTPARRPALKRSFSACWRRASPPWAPRSTCGSPSLPARAGSSCRRASTSWGGRNWSPAWRATRAAAPRPPAAAQTPAGAVARSLLLTGHIDSVDVEPREQWTSDPFVATERDGLLFGRGTNDMKGGLAALIVALEALHDAGVALAGDVVFASVTDEESSGMGSWSVVRRLAERGIHPDAGLCAEPTEFEAWVACRGILKPRLTIPGRAGHSQEPQPGWRDGGAVNAIDKLVPVLTEVRRINDDWRTRADQRHPYLAPGDIVPVLVDGGTWDVTFPAYCHLTLDCHYLPAHWHPAFGAEPVKAEIRERIDTAAAADPWLAEHPIAWEWEWEVPPAEIAADHPLVTTVLAAAADLGHPSHPGGLDRGTTPRPSRCTAPCRPSPTVRAA